MWTRLRRYRHTLRKKRFYRQFIRSGDLVFDVGANIGNHSRLFRSIGARVVAFEPQGTCADVLALTFAHDPDFTLVRAAVSHSEGQAQLHIGPSDVLSTVDTDWIAAMNRGGRFANHWHRHDMVSITTLDAAIEQFGLPDLLKIDVEGHEWAVLRGLSVPVRYLSFEFASESLDNTARGIAHLDTLGAYSFRHSLAEHHQLEGPDWCSGGEMMRRLRSAAMADARVWGDVYARS